MPGGTSLSRAEAPEFRSPTLSSEVDSVSSVQIIDARPVGELVPPPFPETLPRTDRRLVRIPIRIVIDRAGRVQSVSLNPGVFASTIPSFDVYWESIQKTVAAWQFSPAKKIYLVPTPGRSTMTIQEEYQEMYLDYMITFDPDANPSATKP